MCELLFPINPCTAIKYYRQFEEYEIVFWCFLFCTFGVIGENDHLLKCSMVI